MLNEILEKYPRSELHKYGDWYELRLRNEKAAGCYKISGTVDQVVAAVEIIINKFNF